MAEKGFVVDPNATLMLLREKCAEAQLPWNDNWEGVAYELADLVEALDEWLTKGGHLPTNWER